MSQIFTVDGQGTIVVKYVVKVGKVFSTGNNFAFFVDLCNNVSSTSFAFETIELAELYRNTLIVFISKEE